MSSTDNAGPEVERLVLVGRRYQTMSTNWSEWDKPFGEVVQEIADRAKDNQKASGHPDEVLEVVVTRRAIVKAAITVEETTGG